MANEKNQRKSQQKRNQTQGGNQPRERQQSGGDKDPAKNNPASSKK